MKQFTVSFKDVGRNNRTWSMETENVSYEFLRGQVKEIGGIMSRDIDFGYVNGTGTVFAGMRSVGTFEITGNTPEAREELERLED